MKTATVVIAMTAIVLVGGVDEFKEIDRIKQEPPCSSEGGICVLVADCPNGQLTEKSGLCPKQKSKGIECCYGLSVKETRCAKRGGSCIAKKEPCNPMLVFDNASDCGSDKKCCIRV